MSPDAGKTQEAPPKPLLRGVSHAAGFFVAAIATAVVASTQPSHVRAAMLVFGGSLMLLLGTSALYHRIHWAPVPRARMRRLDHAAIFILIGGGYTPLFALIPSSSGGHGALWAIWGGVLLGVVKSVFWPNAPKWVTALVCVVLGWTVTGRVIDRYHVVGGTCVWLLVVSGAIYSIGALVYALKRPDPSPRVFGYHEIFHAAVLVASGCLFAHVMLVLRAAR
jgi:hemolysin III